ncbi:MAG: hypothetical protein ACPL3E_01715 [Minisyncoccia bacterium]
MEKRVKILHSRRQRKSIEEKWQNPVLNSIRHSFLVKNSGKIQSLKIWIYDFANGLGWLNPWGNIQAFVYDDQQNKIAESEVLPADSSIKNKVLVLKFSNSANLEENKTYDFEIVFSGFQANVKRSSNNEPYFIITGSKN